MEILSRKALLVEGSDDCHAIIHLMKAHVRWGTEPAERPVHIEVCGGVDTLLKPRYIHNWLARSDVDILGIVVDADGNADERWNALRRECQDAFPDLPQDLPPNGLVADNAKGRRLGVWVMPDNTSRGMLESFLRFLVPTEQEPIWLLAQEVVGNAVTLGATCRKCHRDKADIHTWLAWQDPPPAKASAAR